MDAIVTKTHRAVLTVIASAVKERKEGKFFNTNYIAADANGNKELFPGMIVAEVGSYYVPYNASSAYGATSYVPVGILNEYWDMTLYPKMVSPVTEGTFIEDYCYVYGSAVGTIPAAVKSALTHIQWK